MNADQERLLRAWLDARDPGAAPARLRAAAANVSSETRPASFPGVDAALWRIFGRGVSLRPVVILLALLLVVLAIAGALVLRPWQTFPPRGLIAYTIASAADGRPGIRLITADGTGERDVSGSTSNDDHSPRWSADGRSLLFARNHDLDPVNSCGGLGSIVLYDVATGTEQVLVEEPRPIGAVAWSPSGDRIAFLEPAPGCGSWIDLGELDVATGRVTTSRVGFGAGGSFQLQWTGESVAAIEDSCRVQRDQPDSRRQCIPIAQPSSDGRYVARSSPRQLGDPRSRLEIQDVGSGVGVDLGFGWLPAWAPDDSAVAFVRPVDHPDEFDQFQHALIVATGPSFAPRIVAAVKVDMGVDIELLTTLRWTSDGRAIYWMDVRGGHVVDVASGQVANIPGVPIGCPDLDWQPLPPG